MRSEGLGLASQGCLQSFMDAESSPIGEKGHASDQTCTYICRCLYLHLFHRISDRMVGPVGALCFSIKAFIYTMRGVPSSP